MVLKIGVFSSTASNNNQDIKDKVDDIKEFIAKDSNKKTEEQQAAEEKVNDEDTAERLETAAETEKEQNNEEEIKIFKWPSLSEKSEKKDGTLDSMFKDAEDFVKTGDEEKINLGDFQTLSARIYNIVLQIGIGLSVIVGLILGIKFMLASPTEKAEVTKMLQVYVIACIVIFGSFGIWKLLVTLFSQI